MNGLDCVGIAQTGILLLLLLLLLVYKNKNTVSGNKNSICKTKGIYNNTFF